MRDLAVEFHLPEGVLTAPDGISFQVNSREVVGVVGESGCGKSVTALSIMGLVPNPPGRIVSGQILFRGKNLPEHLSEVRGREISMVFQNPLNSLNPSLRIGLQLAEVLVEHLGLDRAAAELRVVEIMNRLGIPDARRLMRRYSFEYSGGMRQRIMVAMAMLCNPQLMIADEPTTALDVTIQAQMLHLFRQLRAQFHTSIIYISHDLSVVSQLADRVLVMYAGKIVERSPAERLFSQPRHPYTRGLIRSVPGAELPRGSGTEDPERDAAGADSREARTPGIGSPGIGRLPSIPGSVPNLIRPPGGCRFHPRCASAMDLCRATAPPEFPVDGSEVSCWLYRGKEAI